MKGVTGDLCEGPPRLRAIAACTLLKNVTPCPPPHQFLVVAVHWVRPRDAPRLTRRIPRPQRRAVHVLRPIRIGPSLVTSRHDPHVLDGASLEHASRVDLSSEALSGNV